MSRISRREDVFYTMLKDLSTRITLATEDYSKLITTWPDSKDTVEVMRAHEEASDVLVGEILTELETSFITPFDRQDIEFLARALDSIVDEMEGISARLVLFDVHDMLPAAKRMCELTCQATADLNESVQRLPNFKKDPEVKRHARNVGALEDEGDIVYRNALGDLFHDFEHTIHVVKWTRLLDSMENCLDNCQTSANIISGILTKNA